jgi:hypothetical protein
MKGIWKEALGRLKNGLAATGMERDRKALRKQQTQAQKTRLEKRQPSQTPTPVSSAPVTRQEGIYKIHAREASKWSE